MEEQLKADYGLLTAFWNFWKAHREVKHIDDDEYWDGMLEDANVFANEHPEPYARVLIVSLLLEFERRSKEVCKSST